jgi:hypothetical protein
MGYYVESWTDTLLKFIGGCVTLTILVMSFLNFRLKQQKLKDIKDLSYRMKAKPEEPEAPQRLPAVPPRQPVNPNIL